MSNVQLKHLVAAAADFYSVPVTGLLTRSRKSERAKRVIGYLAVKTFGYSLARVAQYLECDPASLNVVDELGVPFVHVSLIAANAEHRSITEERLLTC